MSHARAGMDMSRHVAAALECHRTCEETITYCLEQGGRHAEAAHIRLMTDCADICRTAADFMVRGSQFHSQICAVCADVCDACADDCATFGEDAQMTKCVQACRECARLCREMAGAMR